MCIFAANYAEIMYIHQHQDWTNFRWEGKQLMYALAEVRNLQGRLLGKMEALGFEIREEAMLDTLTLEIMKSSEIEEEYLAQEQVRSSVARRLGMAWAVTSESNRWVDGFVDMMLDATQKYDEALTAERLFDWHSALFTTGRNGIHKIRVGQWRDDAKGYMQVVSGTIGNEKVHFQAPDAVRVAAEMEQFIAWFNTESMLDSVLKASIAHLWFITIHPFEDGNGRIARALAEMLLARSDKSSQRFYSMSAQIRLQRKGYYEVLETTQKGSGDISKWLYWFLDCFAEALKSTEALLAKVLYKATFWHKHAQIPLNERQKLLLNRLLDDFQGHLTSAKWAKIAKCSTDTALRDIQDLVSKGILRKELAGGRSTHYVLYEETF